MNRIDRLSAILIQLQSKKVVRAADIAERFDISLRTVYRDIRALEEAGVPIGAEAGLGYFLMEGYNLPPVKFSKDEAGALLMASKLADKQTDHSIKKHLDSALFKIRSALKIEEKDYLESIENNIEVISVRQAPQTNQFPDHFLSDIQTALAQKRVLNFDYYSNYNDTFTNRDVDALSLCYYSGHWHLIGYCNLRQSLRDFRSDRIMKLKVTDTTFDASKHKDYKGYVASVMQATDLQEVVVSFDKVAARYIKDYRYFMGYVESELMGDWEKMTFMTNDLETFARWMLQFSNSAKVISPVSLNQLVISLFEKGLAQHTHSKS